MAPVSPESPLPRGHNPGAQEEIGYRMRNDTGGQAPGSVRDQIVERARQQRRDPIFPRMRDRKSNRHHPEGKPGEGPDRDLGEFFVDQVAQKKAAPENFLDQGNHYDEAQKTKYDRSPIQRR